MNQYTQVSLRALYRHTHTHTYPCSDSSAVSEIDYYDNEIAVLKTQKR